MGGAQSIEKEQMNFKSHERMGIFRHTQSGSQRVVEILRELPSERLFNEWVERVKDVKLSMVGVDVLYLPSRYYYHKTQLCGSGGTARIVFQQWENFLKEEVSNRRKNQNYYQQQELWFILYSLVKAGMLYQGRNVKIGDLHPNNIVVTPQGMIRIITQDSLPLQKTNYEKIVEEIKSDVYLAPQEMDEQMIESGAYIVKEPSKADVFSFGVTMLETITLENCAYLYIRNPLRISFEKMQMYTDLMKEKYSSFLHETILSVLNPNPLKRKSFLQIYEMLKPYEDKILDLQFFELLISRAKKDTSAVVGSLSQSRLQQNGKSISGSVKGSVSPPSIQYIGFNRKI